MSPIQQRKMELWFACAACAVTGGLFCWFAILRELAFLWWFAATFLIVMLLLAWKATRPASVFEKEESRFEEFRNRHPVLSAVLALGTIAGGLWSLGCMIFRIVESLMK